MERLHKVSAGFIFAFICLHFANHLIGLEGRDAHQQFIEAARLIYRHPIVEMVLLMAFAVQIITGIALARQIWAKKKDFIHQLQAASGTYLAIFIVLHVLWVFIGRMTFNLDTNFDFVAATMTTPAWSYVFMPLYGLAIVSLFTHIGCITYDIFKKTDKRLGWACLVLVFGGGLYVTYLILMMYSGRLYPITVPEAYTDVFGRPAASAPALETLPAAPQGADKPDAPKAPDEKTADDTKQN